MHILAYFLKKNISYFFPVCSKGQLCNFDSNSYNKRHRMSMHLIKCIKREDCSIIANFQESKYLLISSLTFFPLSYYLFVYKQTLKYHALLIFMNASLSLLFWLDARYDSWRRQLDLWFSKFCALVLFHNQCLHFQHMWQKMIGIFLYTIILHNFSLSSFYHSKHHRNWYKYHAMFHVFVWLNIFTTASFILLDHHHRRDAPIELFFKNKS